MKTTIVALWFSLERVGFSADAFRLAISTCRRTQSALVKSQAQNFWQGPLMPSHFIFKQENTTCKYRRQRSRKEPQKVSVTKAVGVSS